MHDRHANLILSYKVSIRLANYANVTRERELQTARQIVCRFDKPCRRSFICKVNDWKFVAVRAQAFSSLPEASVNRAAKTPIAYV